MDMFISWKINAKYKYSEMLSTCQIFYTCATWWSSFSTICLYIWGPKLRTIVSRFVSVLILICTCFWLKIPIQKYGTKKHYMYIIRKIMCNSMLMNNSMFPEYIDLMSFIDRNLEIRMYHRGLSQLANYLDILLSVKDNIYQAISTRLHATIILVNFPYLCTNIPCLWCFCFTTYRLLQS